MTAIMAVAAQSEAGENGRVEAVPHGVHRARVEHRPIDRIVEAIPPNLVGRLEDPRDGDRR